eukprot:GEMP01048533.1.p1 GENE.GEMP01048533.1~~GEMP01048533.1.p1  ORF type:complete len:414 (+),score=95.80 GEMP01048533.1:123-1364(+)
MWTGHFSHRKRQSIESVIAAMKTVWSVDADFQEARIAIADPLVALVIGKSGSMIKEIQQQTGANLSFCKPTEMGSLERSLRALSINGDDSAICQTVALVLELVKDKVETTSSLMETRDLPRVSSRPQPPEIRSGPTDFATMKPRQPLVESNIMSSMGQRMGDISEQFFVPPEIVRLAIGKSGTSIKRAQQETGCKISFAKEDENVNGVPYRRVTLTGRVASVAAAATYVAKQDDRHEACVLLLLPDNSVSFVIGTHGASIKNITELSRAFLSFAKPEEMGQLEGRERILSVRGSLDQVGRALEMVINMNQDCLNRGEKRPEAVGQMMSPGSKKAKWETAPANSDVVLVVAKKLCSEIDIQAIQSTYSIMCNVHDSGSDMVIEMSGENSVNAQLELQLMMQSRAGPLRWRVQAV